MKKLNELYKTLCHIQDLVEKDCTIQAEIAELSCTTPLIKLYVSLSQILKENKVMNDEEAQLMKINKILEFIVKVQGKILD